MHQDIVSKEEKQNAEQYIQYATFCVKKDSES